MGANAHAGGPPPVRRGAGAAAVALAAAAGCAGFVEPSPEVRALVRGAPRDPDGPVRCRVRVGVESPWLHGWFEGVCLAETGARPRVRLQLFPDMGGKALDLLATPERIAGVLPLTGEGATHAVPEPGRPTAIYCLGASLLEHHAPLTETRLRGMRPASEGHALLLAPAVPGLRVVAVVGPDGAVRRRELTLLGWVDWAETDITEAGFVLEAAGVRLQVQMLERRPVPSLPDAAFALVLPEDLRPLGEGP